MSVLLSVSVRMTENERTGGEHEPTDGLHQREVAAVVQPGHDVQQVGDGRRRLP